MHVAQSLVFGAGEVEHPANLQHRPCGAIASERVDMRRGLARHQHRNRCVARVRGLDERDPDHAVARIDDVSHRLAGNLHGLLVVVGIGVRQVDDRRIVDKRRVGSLLRVYQVGIIFAVAVVRESGSRHAREQAKRYRERNPQRASGKRGPRCRIVPAHWRRTLFRGTNDATISAKTASSVTNSKRPAHIWKM